jgi:NAD(P)-dependent dehydrogenase (short-subunit alcohol dehydrogenase family)
MAMDLPDSDLEETRRLVEGHGRSFVGHKGNVADAAAWISAVDRLRERYGRLDILVNNAGVTGHLGPITEYPDDVFDQVMAVNVRGVFLGMKYCLPILIENRGNGLNIASIAGLGGGRNIVGYATSKRAVIALTLAAAGENAGKGVRFNAVCPGPADTAMMDFVARQSAPGNPQSYATAAKQRMPMGRYAEPAEIANLVAFLASPAAEFINGALVPIDGGMTAL